MTRRPCEDAQLDEEEGKDDLSLKNYDFESVYTVQYIMMQTDLNRSKINTLMNKDNVKDYGKNDIRIFYRYSGLFFTGNLA